MVASFLAFVVLLGAAGGAGYQVAIDLSLALTIVVSVPLALRILDFQRSQRFARVLRDRLRSVHIPCALCALGALALVEPGVLAALIGFPWILFTGAVAVCGVLCSATYRGAWRIEQRGADIACVYLTVGGTWFFASLSGSSLMGFSEPIVRLTAVHFHVASFCLVLISTSLGYRAIQGSDGGHTGMRWALLLHVLSPAIVALGITFSRTVEVIGALSLVLSWAVIVVLTVRAGALRSFSASSRWLLAVSCLCLAITLGLAVSYSVGRLPVLPVMAVTHGLINAGIVVPAALLALVWSPVPVADGGDLSLLQGPAAHVPISDRGWKMLPLIEEHFEEPLGYLSSEAFEKIGELIASYSVYSARFLESSAIFREEGRNARIGDRVYQRLHLLHLRDEPILTVPSLVEIERAEFSEQCKELGYVTTRFHVGVGRWCLRVTRDLSGHGVLTIDTASRPRGVFLLTLPLFRVLQVRARRDAIQRIRSLC